MKLYTTDSTSSLNEHELIIEQMNEYLCSIMIFHYSIRKKWFPRKTKLWDLVLTKNYILGLNKKNDSVSKQIEYLDLKSITNVNR